EPHNIPDTAPCAMGWNSWFSLTRPSASFTATTASPSSIRYSFCIASSISRTPSAFASVGNSMKRRSDIAILHGAQWAERLCLRTLCLTLDLERRGVEIDRPQCAFGRFDDSDASSPIHRDDLACRMLDLDVVQQDYLQHLGDRIAADGSGLNLCA